MKLGKRSLTWIWLRDMSISKFGYDSAVGVPHSCMNVTS